MSTLTHSVQHSSPLCGEYGVCAQYDRCSVSPYGLTCSFTAELIVVCSRSDM